MSSDALPLLSVRGVGKTYAQPVLAEIDLQLFGGEVLALTGENGAGKSTLSKIIGGLERPGSGSLELLGRPYAPGSRREAEALGVRMVMQELNLLPTLSVAENLFLHDLPRRAGWIDRRRLRRLDLGPRRLGAPLLRVEKLSRRGKVHEVSFEVRAGEIFGLSGLIGSGRTELLRLIYGADRADGGQVLLGDPPQRLSLRSPADSVRQGVALITEDRKGEGLLLSQSISANLALGNLPALARHGIIDRRREEALARRQVEALRVRCADIAQAVGELSGGNQQKVVIGRWLERDCQVLLFDEPTRGIDIGAKFDIYALLAELTRQGKALVVVSSDLRELMLICDRIGVLSAGRLVDIFARDAWSQDALLAAAFAGYRKRDALLATS
ncbi:sugar ABC transporter ATPase [Pseudomonas aeruginosa VRFPA01]|nr:sugar ABC transporter ATPase [Pseudomonas aeruginosa VRFPA01]